MRRTERVKRQLRTERVAREVSAGTPLPSSSAVEKVREQRRRWEAQLHDAGPTSIWRKPSHP